MTLSQIVSLVPEHAVGRLSITNWAALRHRTDGFATQTITGSWLREGEDFRDQVGVGPTDSDWQVEFAVSRGTETITQWTDGAKLARVVDSLQRHGWRRSGSGHLERLTRSAPLSEPGWRWAFNQNFVVERARGLLIQHPRSAQPALPAARSQLDVPGVRTVVARMPDLITGQIRSGDLACPLYGLRELSPPPSRAIVRRYALAVGGLHKIDAVGFGVTGTDGRSGTATVALPSTTQAEAELAARARAVTLLPDGPRVRVTDARRYGAADTFRVAAGTPIDTHGLSEQMNLGADSCGVN